MLPSAAYSSFFGKEPLAFSEDRVEDALIRSGRFRLPGKKSLQLSEQEWQVLVVDVSETPIERPQKNSEVTTLAKRNNTISSAR